jgi:hypothetical protein
MQMTNRVEFVEVARQGPPGPPGKSAYRVWLAAGNTGTEAEFLAALEGQPGESAYQVWLAAGNIGSAADFLASLKGADGETPNLALPVGFEFTTESGTPVLRLETTNPATSATGTSDVAIPIASATRHGFMSASDVDALSGRGARYPVHFGSNAAPSQAELQTAWEAASGQTGSAVDGATLVDLDNKHGLHVV